MARSSSRSGVATAGLAVAALLTAGCPKAQPVAASYRGGATPPATPDASEEPPEAKDPSLVARMHGAFGAVARIQDALVEGRVAEAVAEAGQLGNADAQHDAPDSWAPYLEGFNDAARSLAEAQDDEGAAQRAAALVVTCGQCHAGLSANVQLPEPPEPAGPDAPMKLHAWAVDRMWEGLVLPSEDRFLRGTATLALLPTCEGAGEAETQRCQRFRSIVQRTHVADSDAARQQLYGRLLSTCSDCHRASATAP